MAPWSSKLLNPGSRNEQSTNPAGASATTPGRSAPGPTRVTEADILQHAYGIPTLQTATPTRGRRGHGRSISHPFPLPFGRKKKEDDTRARAGVESSDDEKVAAEAARSAALNPTPRAVKVADKDMAKGNCMTCDCVMRWPKELSVFRCMVCATINDLKPVRLEAKRIEGQWQRIIVKRPAGTYPGSTFAPKIMPLSVEKTRKLIEDSITSYLLARLRHDEGDANGFVPQSPILEHNEILDNDDPAQLHTLMGGSMRFPMPPGRQLEERSRSRSKLRNLLQVGSAPQATSPGNFLESHMERRDRSSHRSRSRDPDGEIPQDFESTVGDENHKRRSADAVKNLFKPLLDYIVLSFGSFECVNPSFSTLRPTMASRTASEGGSRRLASLHPYERRAQNDENLSDIDAKTLLLGDFAENGSWWTGDLNEPQGSGVPRVHRHTSSYHEDLVTLKSPRLDWAEMAEWYFLVLNAGRLWKRRLDELIAGDTQLSPLQDKQLHEIEDVFTEAQSHVQRTLLKSTESLLKRPGRLVKEPSNLRFLLIILANPLLYPSPGSSKPRERSRSRSTERERGPAKYVVSGKGSPAPVTSNTNRGSSGQHSGIIKRILGILSYTPNECHHFLVSWFARYSDGQFQRTADLIGSFVTYRLTRQHGRKREVESDPTAGLVPNMIRGGTSAALHAALGHAQTPKKSDGKPAPVVYNDDWQIKAAARVMQLVSNANNSGLAKRGETRPSLSRRIGHSAGLVARERAHVHGQIIPTSDFYNTLLDYSDLIADFDAYETKRGKFTFCQYPFFLSIWAKIKIMEHDARRQMEIHAREAWFSTIMTAQTVPQYFVIRIRRECLVEDSFRGVSEGVGPGQIKKALRIEFKGEEGVDAGGLRKEWFLLLVRDVFNPDHGMFTYDEDSHFCYFNPQSFETSDQFNLVGVVLGLAIYNSTILDVGFPPFLFRKLLAAGPAPASGANLHPKLTMTYSLEDLAEYRPSLAHGLRQLLDYDGNVEETFCRNFVADVERFGQISEVPLCHDGENKPVTNANRREFVDLYVRYLLDTAVTRQFEPFKRGFFNVCDGNALNLFRPEEIELLVRGSDEPLDIASLQAVCVCENWVVPNAKETEPVIRWFWESFFAATSEDQRKLLSFITGSDRIPAMGSSVLIIKLSCLGEDCARFPSARTCFNTLSLWRYKTKEKLEKMLWRAVHESEGFGLK